MSLFGGLKVGGTVAPAFGSPATSASATTTTASSAFGAPAAKSLFGGPTSTGGPAPAGRGFATSTPAFGTASAAPAFGAAAAPFGFGSTATSGANVAKPLFGAATTQQPSLFGSAAAGQSTQTTSLFGAKPTTTTAASGFLGFGSKPGVTSTQAQQPLRANTLQDVIQNSDNLIRSLTAPEIFGDGRDVIMAKLNQILAACGIAGGYFRSDQQPVTYNDENAFYRFKALGYSRRSEYHDRDGVVALILAINYEQIYTAGQRQKFIDAMNVILGNNTNIRAHIELVRPLPDNQTEVLLYVTEKGRGRPTSTEICAYLKQPTQEAQLKNQLAVVNVVSRISMDDSKLNFFMKNPPPGFDPLIWKQAIAENPDPERLLPYPVRGFAQLRKRQEMQVTENRLEENVIEELKRRLNSIFSELSDGQNRCTYHQQKQKELSHRLLRCLAIQALIQQYTVSIDCEEEKLESRLEALNACLSAPNQIKSRITNLMTILREESDLLKEPDKISLSLAESDVAHIRKYLGRAQQALELLVSTITSNKSDLSIIENNSH